MSTHPAPAAIRGNDVAIALLLVGGVFLLWALRDVAMLVAFALIIACVLDPIVTALQRIPLPGGRRLPRALCSLLVIVVVVTLIGWLAAIATPLLAAQLGTFLQRLPDLIEIQIEQLRTQAIRSGWSAGFDQVIESLRANARTFLPQAAGFLVTWIGGLFSRVDQLLGLAVLPILTFYILADRERVRSGLLRFLPRRVHEGLLARGPAVNRALQSYVRGQTVVCVTMGVGTWAVLAIAGVPNALFLGVLAGLGEIVPFLGALVTSLAILLSGLSLDLGHGLIGLALYTLNNWLLGSFVTPRVMERYLEMHPFTVIVAVLAGAQLLGPAGAILALPIAAVTQALVTDQENPAS